MGVLINHTIAFLTSPFSVSLAIIVLGAILGLRAARRGRSCRCGWTVVLVGLAYLYLFSNGWMYGLLGEHLERMYPPARVETLPKADAIVVLGGGVGENTNLLYYAELALSADRAVHGARLFKAGKAPRVHVTFAADAELLAECGVPQTAISIDEGLKNTEQEFRSLAERLKTTGRPRVLLVTSAWHMRRAMLMAEKYAQEIEVVPAACDYEYLASDQEENKIKRFLGNFLPSSEILYRNTFVLKEYIGYWGYRLLRK